MAKGKLGRGLDFLLSKVEPRGEENEILHLQLDEVHPNKAQPRREFNEQPLNELMDSISQNGILQPVIVRADENGYEIIAGERRWRAACLLELDTIPAIVRQADDAKTLELALVENLQREDLNPIEQARAYKALIDQFDLTQEQLAQRIGKTRSSIANTIRLLDLAQEVQDFVSRGTLSMGHARAILALSKPAEQIRLARKVIDRGLSVRQVEQIVSAALAEAPLKHKAEKSASSRDLEDRLREVLGTRVTIQEGKKRGKIIIDYFSIDDFQRIFDKLAK